MTNLEPKWRDKYYDAVAECEAIKKQRDILVKALSACIARAGNPDAVVACRLVIATAKKALKDIIQ